MDLNGDERRKLREAIISAYPSKTKLKMMVSDKLEENLNAIAGGENLEEVVFELIEWAEAQGKLKQLIDAACQGKAGNLDLQAVRKKIHKQELQEILNKLREEEFQYIKKAYQYCTPPDWEVSRIRSDNLTEIIEQISQMPNGDSSYTKLEKFVTYLIADSKLDKLIISELKEWAKINIKDFSELLEQVKKDLKQKYKNEKYKNKKSYLLIVINPRSSSHPYTVSAWIIPEIKSYNSLSGNGCEQLHLPGDDNKVTEIDKIPDIVQEFLKESAIFHPRNLTIEIFLPFKILHHAIDNWQLKDDYGFLITLGKHYIVVIRSYDRLFLKYREKRIHWEEKWEYLQDLKTTAISNYFYPVNDDNINDTFDQLLDTIIIGIKASKAPKKVGPGSFFAAILSSAIPIALWLRKDLESKDCLSEIDTILNCKIDDLPEVVRKKRSEAKNPDTDIGYHLSLLWEDPYRLPPTYQLKLD